MALPEHELLGEGLQALIRALRVLGRAEETLAQLAERGYHEPYLVNPRVGAHRRRQPCRAARRLPLARAAPAGVKMLLALFKQPF